MRRSATPVASLRLQGGGTIEFCSQGGAGHAPADGFHDLDDTIDLRDRIQIPLD